MAVAICRLFYFRKQMVGVWVRGHTLSKHFWGGVFEVSDSKWSVQLCHMLGKVFVGRILSFPTIVGLWHPTVLFHLTIWNHFPQRNDPCWMWPPAGVSSGSYASRLTKIKGVTFKGVIDTSFPAPQIANVPLSYHWLVRLWVQQPTPTHSTKWSSSLSRVTWLTKWWENIKWQTIVILFCQPSCSLPSFYNRFLLF